MWGYRKSGDLDIYNATPLVWFFSVLLNYIVHLNLIIATSAGTLMAGIAHVFHLDHLAHYGLLGFFSTLSVYNGQRLFKSKTGAKTPVLEWVDRHNLLVAVLTVISGLLSVYFLIQVSEDVTIALVLLIGLALPLSFFYVVPIKGKNIRERAHLKTHVVAFTWTSVTAAFPIMNESIHDLGVSMLFIPALYLYFMAIAIPFDIRDLKYDSPTQRTIPQVIGIRRAKLLTIMLLVIVIAVLAVFSNYHFIQPFYAIAILVQICLIALIRKELRDIYYTVFIDGAVSLLGISFLLS